MYVAMYLNGLCTRPLNVMLLLKLLGHTKDIRSYLVATVINVSLDCI